MSQAPTRFSARLRSRNASRVDGPTSRSRSTSRRSSLDPAAKCDNKFRKKEGEKPYTFVTIGVIIAFLAYAMRRTEAEDRVDDGPYNLKLSLAGVTLVYLGYAILTVKDGTLLRPHPAVWRVFHGFMVVYLVILTAMLLNTAKTVRSVLSFMEMTKMQEQKTGDWDMMQCDINPTNLMRQIKSIWFTSHLLGWFGKSLMLRSWRLTWFFSIFFEVLEVSLRCIIPDFRECWWDSVFVDVFGANLLGILLGHGVLRLFNLQLFEDLAGGHPCPPSQPSLVNRALGRFSPWPVWRWASLSTIQGVGLFSLVASPLVFQINTFFLLKFLWIPPSFIPAFRLFILLSFAVVAFNDFYYEYEKSPAKNKRIPVSVFLGILVMVVEVLVIIKFSDGELSDVTDENFLFNIGLPWLSFLGMLALWLFVSIRHTQNLAANPSLEASEFDPSSSIWSPSTWTTRDWLDITFYVCFIPLIQCPYTGWVWSSAQTTL